MYKIAITLFCLLAINHLMAQYKELYEKKEFISGNDTLKTPEPLNYSGFRTILTARI